MTIGLLALLLNGAAFRLGVVDFTPDTERPTSTGQFIATIDTAAFGDVEAFTAAANRSCPEMRASPTLPGRDPVRVPGEGREAARAQRLAEAIPIHPALRAERDRISADRGIPAF